MSADKTENTFLGKKTRSSSTDQDIVGYKVVFLLWDGKRVRLGSDAGYRMSDPVASSQCSHSEWYRTHNMSHEIHDFSTDCTCGFHAYSALSDAREHTRGTIGAVVIKARYSGEYALYEKGIRAHRQRVLALDLLDCSHGVVCKQPVAIFALTDNVLEETFFPTGHATDEERGSNLQRLIPSCLFHAKHLAQKSDAAFMTIQDVCDVVSASAPGYKPVAITPESRADALLDSTDLPDYPEPYRTAFRLGLDRFPMRPPLLESGWNRDHIVFNALSWVILAVTGSLLAPVGWDGFVYLSDRF